MLHITDGKLKYLEEQIRDNWNLITTKVTDIKLQRMRAIEQRNKHNKIQNQQGKNGYKFFYINNFSKCQRSKHNKQKSLPACRDKETVSNLLFTKVPYFSSDKCWSKSKRLVNNQ